MCCTLCTKYTGTIKRYYRHVKVYLHFYWLLPSFSFECELQISTFTSGGVVYLIFLFLKTSSKCSSWESGVLIKLIKICTVVFEFSSFVCPPVIYHGTVESRYLGFSLSIFQGRGHTRLIIKGRVFRDDCTGFIQYFFINYLYPTAVNLGARIFRRSDRQCMVVDLRM